MSPHLR